ncbi:uncharacterized protein METZ01_LOCUS405785, partial [marine metagenome]
MKTKQIPIILIVLSMILITSCEIGEEKTSSIKYNDYTIPDMIFPTIPGGSIPPSGGDDPGDDYYPGEENFGELTFNGFVSTSEDNLSTFSFDVDEGSYTFGRNKINSGMLPPEESVRIEEYINYFQQDYESPLDDPFSV